MRRNARSPSRLQGAWATRWRFARLPERGAPGSPHAGSLDGHRGGILTTRPPRQVRFERARLEPVAPDRCAAQVELRSAAATYVGRAEGGCMDVDGLRAAARATADALQDLGDVVLVDGVDVVPAFGEPAVVVRVTAEHEGETRRLVGFCLAGDDPLRATVLAVLNATNRFLEIG